MNVPPLHERLIKLGFFDKLYDKNGKLAIYDVKFPTRPLDAYISTDRIVEILPFAVNGAGDAWGYLCSKLPYAPVTLFYHDDTIAEEVATDIESFFVLQLVNDAMYGTSEEHPGISKGWTRSHILRMCNELLPLFSTPAVEALEELKNTIESVPENYDLHPIDEATGRKIIEKLVPQGVQFATYEWQQY